MQYTIILIIYTCSILDEPCCRGHLSEEPLPGEEVGGGVALDEGAVVEHHDLVVAEDGVEAVGDGEDGAAPELGLDGVLDQVVSAHIHAGRGLVQQQDLVPCHGVDIMCNDGF